MRRTITVKALIYDTNSLLHTCHMMTLKKKKKRLGKVEKEEGATCALHRQLCTAMSPWQACSGPASTSQN